MNAPLSTPENNEAPRRPGDTDAARDRRYWARALLVRVLPGFPIESLRP